MCVCLCVHERTCLLQWAQRQVPDGDIRRRSWGAVHMSQDGSIVMACTYSNNNPTTTTIGAQYFDLVHTSTNGGDNWTVRGPLGVYGTASGALAKNIVIVNRNNIASPPPAPPAPPSPPSPSPLPPGGCGLCASASARGPLTSAGTQDPGLQHELTL